MRGNFQYPVRRQRAMGDVPTDPQTGQPIFAPGEMPNRSPIESGPRDWYSYQAFFDEVDDGTNAVVNVPIEADSNFYLTSLQYFVGTATGDPPALDDQIESTFVLPNLAVLITDSGSGRNLMSAPQPLPALMGDGKRPHRLIHPRLFKRTTNIVVALTNYGAIDYFAVYIVLEGFKVYGDNR